MNSISAPLETSTNKSEDPELSVVVPVYNEEKSVSHLISTIVGTVENLVSTYELIVVDDGSMDGTGDLTRALALKKPKIKLIQLSRNFGKESALDAGLMLSKGQAVLFIDGDLQHPPELIPTMLESWRSGSDVVNARKRHRGSENLLYRFLARRFYRFFSSLSGIKLDGASDFKLIDRQVADALKSCPERNRFFRGLVAWVGFNQQDILFDVGRRHDGKSGWSIAKLISYSSSNILSFTSLPLIAIAGLGIVAVFISIILMIQTLINYFLGNAVAGFTTVLVAISFFGSITLLSVGVVALYIAKIYDEQKARPVYIVRTERHTRDSQLAE